MADVVVRPEREGDAPSVSRVHDLAFGRPDEGVLVDRLRRAGRVLVSLVAVDADGVVGHVLFSPVAIESPAGRCAAAGLGPLAVVPVRQRRGIGAALVAHGLTDCHRLGHDRVVVLGDPRYYRRFGFRPATRFHIRSEYDVPDDAFMAVALRPDALTNCPGTALYAPEFAAVDPAR